jgi:hypothetical protein
MSPTLLYGILIGAGQLVSSLIVFAMGLHSDPARLPNAMQTESLIGFVLLMIVVSLAYRASKARGETETIGQSAKGAALTALVGAIVTGLGQYAYLAFINPGLRDIQRNLILEGAKAHLATLSPEKLAEDMRHIDHATSPFARAVGYALPTFVFATLMGIAFALIFRAAARRDAVVKTK